MTGGSGPQYPLAVTRLYVPSPLLLNANTVVVVEHEEAMLRAADHLVELGPGAGERGGTVVFQGTPAEIRSNQTVLEAYLGHG